MIEVSYISTSEERAISARDIQTLFRLQTIELPGILKSNTRDIEN